MKGLKNVQNMRMQVRQEGCSQEEKGQEESQEEIAANA
jgi:hypothetical protein